MDTSCWPCTLFCPLPLECVALLSGGLKFTGCRIGNVGFHCVVAVSLGGADLNVDRPAPGLPVVSRLPESEPLPSRYELTRCSICVVLLTLRIW